MTARKLLGLSMVVVIGVISAVILNQQDASAIQRQGRTRPARWLLFTVDPLLNHYADACRRRYHDADGCTCFAGSVVRDFGPQGAKDLYPHVTEDWLGPNGVPPSSDQAARLQAILTECGLHAGSH